MAGNGKQKQKLLYIRQFLSGEADRDHPLSVKDIAAKLQTVGIEAERKSIYADIETLIGFGERIVTVRGRENRYYTESAPFCYDELETIWDTVCTADFISEKKRREIKQKLEELAGKYNKQALRSRVYTTSSTLKHPATFRQTLDIIHQAVAKKKMLKFRYCNINPVGGQKRTTEEFEVSPFIVSCSNGNFILLAGCKGIEGVARFYIDQLESPEIMTEIATDVREFAGDIDFDITCYSKGLFSSYSDISDTCTVTLRCDRSMFNEVTGLFGEDLKITDITENDLEVQFDTEISEQFLSWLFVNSGSVRAVAPETLVQAVRDAAKNLYINYS